MKLIIFSGLPGTGKSTLAETIAREFGIPVFAKDWLEAALLKHLHLMGFAHQADGAVQRGSASLVPNRKTLSSMGYDLLTTLAERQLMLNQSVILDSVAGSTTIQTVWHELASQYDAYWRVIECVSSDESVHRARLKDRQRNIPGWYELEWSEVERVKQHYSVWEEHRLVLDMVQPFDENLLKARKYCE